MTYRVNTTALTVESVDSSGDVIDLNARGERCENSADLVKFIRELCNQGVYTVETRNELITEVIWAGM